MKKVLKFLLTMIVSAAVYLIATMPLREPLAVFTVTDVRPGAVVNPFLSMCFGPAASLGCAISNFYADYISGYPLKVLFQGFIPQFLYGFISFVLWKKLTKGDDHSYRLDSISKILKFTLVVFVYALFSGLCVGYIVQSNFGANFIETVFFVFLNNFDMTMILGCPLMIFANIIVSSRNKEKMRHLSPNELIIIYTCLIELIGVGVITYGSYTTYASLPATTYEIWNQIFIYAAIFINVVLLITLGFIKLIEDSFNRREI